MQNTSVDPVLPVSATSQWRIPRSLTSWKVWLLALFVSLFAIAASICFPAYRRWQAIEYMDREHISYLKNSDVSDLKRWIGDPANGFAEIWSIHKTDPSEQHADVVATFTELQKLEYIRHAPRSLSARELESLTSLTNLKWLNLEGLRLSDEVLAGWIASCPELTTIRLVNTGASIETLRVVSARPSLVNLTIANDLDRGEDLVRSLSVPALQFLPRGPSEQRYLHLEGIPLTDDYLADWIASCPQLKYVELIEAGADVRTLQAVSQLSQVTKLSLQGDGLSDEDFAVMSTMPQLEELSLAGASITGEGISHFIDSTDIWVLWMSETSVSDKGFSQIARMKSLTQLFICECRDVRPTGIAALASMPNLETVVFTPEMITPEIVESLHHLPVLKYVGVVGWPLDEELISAIEEHWVIEWK